MQNGKLNGSVIGIILLVVVAAVIFLPRLLDRGQPEADLTNDRSNEIVDNDNIENTDYALGNPIVATEVDRDGCPTQTEETMAGNQDIYVVAPSSDVAAGTTIFVRLYHEGQPIEDAPEIRADQDYDNTCINFIFEPIDGPFDEGTYEAEFFVNGNSAESVTFEVQ
ncbi:MAG: hypothetical protein HC828_11100 [Blastochloris sp.]|nr:hypothetical protein [Blastochloris sp.]